MYLIKLPGFSTGLWLLELWHLIYPKLLTWFGISGQIFGLISSFLEEKSTFKMLGLRSALLNWIGALTLSLLLKLPQKIGALIRSMKFLSSEVALYLYKSTIRPCMEYCCHICAGAPSSYVGLLDKLQKQICRTVGPSLAASLEPLAHLQNVASSSLLSWYYFGRCSSELA